MNITYQQGDATRPTIQGNKIIVHICNDIGGWGKGFVMALSKRWAAPEQKYREWHRSHINFELGEVQFVQVGTDLWVANLIGQHKVNRDEHGNAPIRYDVVEKGLEKLAAFALEHAASVHMPRIGCGLAGGNWDVMGPIVEKALSAKGIDVTVYDF